MDYKKDYYTILGVGDNATPEELRDAYRRLAKLHHPDKNPGDAGAEERFKAISEAYAILSNEVNRSVYDNYRSATKQTSESKNTGNSIYSGYKRRPFTETKTRTFKASREKRVYVKGSIQVKFQGEPELVEASLRQSEQRFTITPTEANVTITSADIFADGPPAEYGTGDSFAAIFAASLKQPVNCKVITGNREEFYQLDLYEVRIKNPELRDITKHEQYSFGTLEGTLFAYVLHRFEENVTDEYTQYSGATGHVETKEEAGYVYTRQQFYSGDGGTYWADWRRGPALYRTYNNGSAGSAIRGKDRWSGFSWIVMLIILIAIWPKLLLFAIPIIIWILFLILLGWIAAAFNKIVPWIGGLVIAAIVFIAIRSIFLPLRSARQRPTDNRNTETVRSEKKPIRKQDGQADTIITHTLHWQDRDSADYTLQLSVSTSSLHQSALAHDQMDYQQYGMLGIGAVYRNMLQTDSDYLIPVAARFDSLATQRKLDRQQEASMVVSCIQSIPYKLVVDGSCSGNYNDAFVNQYLANCVSDCCKGYSKFGVQSPIEFLADLKGDCDTRALLLYDLLGKLGYHVALLTSNYYKHAVIAVNLDDLPESEKLAVYIDARAYYLWETTSQGFGPGNMPASLSNLNRWEIALIQ